MGRAPRQVMQLRVQLEGLEPAIWRRVLVNASDTFEDLHTTLQLAMGWDDYHLHEFRVGDLRVGIRDGDDEVASMDESRVGLGELLGAGSRFQYEYDPGDGWVHDLEVERVEEVARPLERAVCLGGERACPPEDSGGPSGFEDLLLVLSDPAHERYDERRRGLGEFDPSFFSIAAVNASLQHPR